MRFHLVVRANLGWIGNTICNWTRQAGRLAGRPTFITKPPTPGHPDRLGFAHPFDLEALCCCSISDILRYTYRGGGVQPCTMIVFTQAVALCLCLYHASASCCVLVALAVNSFPPVLCSLGRHYCQYGCFLLRFSWRLFNHFCIYICCRQ